MSTTWEDVARDMAYEREIDRLEIEIQKRNIETVASAIENGFASSKVVTSQIVEELSRLNSQNASQSIGHLSSVLLETIERDTICLPLVASGLGLAEGNDEMVDQLKKMLARGIDAPRFVCKYFEDNCDYQGKTKAKFDTFLSQTLPSHPFFTPKTTLWGYRETVKSYRNSIAHGWQVSSQNETDYVTAFATEWRENVLNPILENFGFNLDGSWLLVRKK